MTRVELAQRRERRRALDQHRHRRMMLRTTIPLSGLVLAGAVVALAITDLKRPTPAPAGIAPPVASATLTTSRLPQDVEIATSGSVSLRLPIDRAQLTAIAFRAVDTPGALALDPSGPISHNIAPREGRPGPETGSVDVGAPAGASAFSPVDGVIRSISPYRVSGRQEGIEIVIAPSSAADRVVRLNHIERIPGQPALRVGEPLQAGVSAIGRIRDFSRVARQELARYTQDGGNHVHIQVVRKAITGLAPG